MCGIVAAVSFRDIVPVLVQGLQRLEYRGYDSCGVAVQALDAQGVHSQGLQRARSTARVAELMAQVQQDKVIGHTGIAHTRWATHGEPAVAEMRMRSEEHTSELQSQSNLVCRLLLEKKNKYRCASS